MTVPMRVTVDTNILNAHNADVIERATALGFEVVQTTVTEREAGHGDSRTRSEALDAIAETGVWDESSWDQMLWAGDEEQCLEDVLRIIADGGFPRPDQRQDLTRGHRRQLRDAMIFCTHVREGRNIFVTADEAAFGGARRRELESRFPTRVFTPQEFLMTFDGRAV